MTDVKTQYDELLAQNELVHKEEVHYRDVRIQGTRLAGKHMYYLIKMADGSGYKAMITDEVAINDFKLSEMISLNLDADNLYLPAMFFEFEIVSEQAGMTDQKVPESAFRVKRREDHDLSWHPLFNDNHIVMNTIAGLEDKFDEADMSLEDNSDIYVGNDRLENAFTVFFFDEVEKPDVETNNALLKLGMNIIVDDSDYDDEFNFDTTYEKDDSYFHEFKVGDITVTVEELTDEEAKKRELERFNERFPSERMVIVTAKNDRYVSKVNMKLRTMFGSIDGKVFDTFYPDSNMTLAKQIEVRRENGDIRPVRFLIGFYDTVTEEEIKEFRRAITRLNLLN